jgi:hypothetical protein
MCLPLVYISFFLVLLCVGARSEERRSELSHLHLGHLVLFAIPSMYDNKYKMLAQCLFRSSLNSFVVLPLVIVIVQDAQKLNALSSHDDLCCRQSVC